MVKNIETSGGSSGNFITDGMYGVIRTDERYDPTKELIRYLTDEATAEFQNEEWYNLTFKIGDKQSLPLVDPITGQLLACFETNPDRHEPVEYSMHNCYETEQVAPIVQFMLDLLHQNFIGSQLSLKNPLDEEPDFPELYVSRDWLTTRGLNRQHFPGDEDEIDLYDLATETYIYNLQVVEDRNL